MPTFFSLFRVSPPDIQAKSHKSQSDQYCRHSRHIQHLPVPSYIYRYTPYTIQSCNSCLNSVLTADAGHPSDFYAVLFHPIMPFKFLNSNRDKLRSAHLALISGRQLHRINACIFLVATTNKTRFCSSSFYFLLFQSV